MQGPCDYVQLTVVNGRGEVLRTLPRCETKAGGTEALDVPLVTAVDWSDAGEADTGKEDGPRHGLQAKIWTRGSVSVDALVTQLVGRSTVLLTSGPCYGHLWLGVALFIKRRRPLKVSPVNVPYSYCLSM